MLYTPRSRMQTHGPPAWRQKPASITLPSIVIPSMISPSMPSKKPVAYFAMARKQMSRNSLHHLNETHNRIMNIARSTSLMPNGHHRHWAKTRWVCSPTFMPITTISTPGGVRGFRETEGGENRDHQYRC